MSVLFAQGAVTDPVNRFPNGELAIALGTNFYGGQWSELVAAPRFAEAQQLMGSAPSSRRTTMRPARRALWVRLGIAVSATTKNPQAAFDFIDVAQREKNIIDAANWGGWIPPNRATDQARLHGLCPAVQRVLRGDPALRHSRSAQRRLPSVGAGMGNATGAIAQDPANTSVDKAVSILKDYVTSQLGADKVEVRQ